jgi:ABC-type amino acid transport substrate-binding protein
MYRMLAAGRLDAIVDTPMNHRLHTSRLGLSDVVPRATLLTEPVYHGLHHRHAEPAARLREALQAMHDSGELQALVARAEAAYLEGLLRP